MRQMGLYEKYIKRLLDIVCAIAALLVFSWLYLLVALLVRTKLGKPILFRQLRPGLIDPRTGRERIFRLRKFRTMTDARDENGELLPDEIRLTRFGKLLRATSLDELPEAINILKGDMSVIGPRPQLVRDMVFMTDEQRLRHTARPGLSGLAQVSGRNAISWEEKLALDLQYVQKITFLGDLKLVWLTFRKVFVRADITQSDEEIDVTADYGDALLASGKISRREYDEKQLQAKALLEEATKTGGAF